MGCLQINKKSQIYHMNQFEIQYGKYNQKWMKQLQTSNLNFNIIFDSHGQADHPAFVQIQKDIRRTFPHQKYLQSAEKLNQFREVLRCLALTFPKIGYTQGINFITGYLLLNKISQKQSLQLLTSIFIHPKFLFIGLYEDNFPLTNLYCKLFWKILKKIDLKLYQWLKQFNIPNQMWIFQWYLTLFIYSFPLQFIQDIFVFIFEQKNFSMLKISLGIILCLKQTIFSREKDEFQFIQLIQKLKDFQKCFQYLSTDKIFKEAHKIKQKIIIESLYQIKKQQKTQNFYMKYFCSNENDRKILYEMFISQQKYQNIEISKSRDNTILMQSYKRNSNSVQILDQILKQSIKRQLTAKKYRSNMGPIVAQSRIFNQIQDKKGWKSEFRIQKIIQKQDETNFSIVKIVNLKDDKFNIRELNENENSINKIQP